MPLMIEVPDDIAALLRAAAEEKGEDVNRYAIAALRDALDGTASPEDFDSHAWWAGLTDEQRQEEIARTAQSLADSDAGRVSPAADVYARLRARYAK
jgi:predicted transcriptional regulator